MVREIVSWVIVLLLFVGISFATVKLVDKLRSDKETLHVFNWSDYINPELITEFEEENNCKVVIDTFDDNETMLAKMLAGATGYDVIFPSSYVVPVLKKHELVQKLDMDKLPNVVANFDDSYNAVLHEDTFKYSIPYAFSVTGIAVRDDKVDIEGAKSKGVEKSWDFLLVPSLNKKICVLNDVREMLGIGLKKNGCSVNSTDDGELKKASEYAISLKKAARRMDNSEYRVGLANGTYIAAIGYSGDILQVKQENPDIQIRFFVPSEGSTCCWDEMSVTTFCRNVDLAHKFIDFLYEPENAARNMEYVCSIQPNKGMWEHLDDDVKENPMINFDKSVLNRVELIKDVGDNIRLHNKWWDEVIKVVR